MDERIGKIPPPNIHTFLWVTGALSFSVPGSLTACQCLETCFSVDTS